MRGAGSTQPVHNAHRTPDVEGDRGVHARRLVDGRLIRLLAENSLELL